MNTNLKKALLLVSASASVLSLSAVTAGVASAGTGYASGSASVTNMDGSTYSAGGEFGGTSQAFNSITVTPNFTAISGTNGLYNVTNLTVTGTATATNFTVPTSISDQVVSVLDGLSGANGSSVGANLSPYVSIIRAAAGANGLE